MILNEKKVILLTEIFINFKNQQISYRRFLSLWVYMIEISLIVTLNNRFNSTQLNCVRFEHVRPYP